MDSSAIGRRGFLKNAGVGFAALTALCARTTNAQTAVPNSIGTELPKLKAPPGTCDCHHHIYDAMRFAPKDAGPQFQPNARVEEYKLLQRRIGTTRNVIVTPAAYVDDNSVTLDAISRLGPNARGVALLTTAVSDAELKRLTDGGVRGVRFSQNPPTVTSTFEMIEPLAKRVMAFGWHVQLFLPADRIVAAEDLWNRLPNTLVFDHLGHLPEPEGTSHPAFSVIRRLIDKGKTWVKLSGAYIDTKIGPPTYADSTKIAQAYAKAAPERMVWGSDWPHPSLAFDKKPNDAVLFDLLSQWAPDARDRNRILVDNPQTLYGFPKI
jgi:predicted TIM-barrel fold metal-dependent hydrolase